MKAIERKALELDEKEKTIRSQLEKNEQIVKKKAVRVGRIALISGLIALVIFWIYNTFFASKKETKKNKSIDTSKSTMNLTFSRLIKLASPYLAKMLTNILELDWREKEEKNHKD